MSFLLTTLIHCITDRRKTQPSPIPARPNHPRQGAEPDTHRPTPRSWLASLAASVARTRGAGAAL